MTEGSPPGTDTRTLQPAAPAEPAEDMDLSDSPKGPPWADENKDRRGTADEDQRGTPDAD